MIWSEIQETTFVSNKTFKKNLFTVEENHVFIEEANPQTKLIQLRKDKIELI